MDKIAKSAVIDALSLYYLASNDLLDLIWNVLDLAIVSYTTIGFFLNAQYGYNDPIIQKIFAWIKSEHSVILEELNFDNQIKYRLSYGEDLWTWKNSFYLALEKNVPIITAILPNECFITRKNIQNIYIWLGDFYEELLRQKGLLSSQPKEPSMH